MDIPDWYIHMKIIQLAYSMILIGILIFGYGTYLAIREYRKRKKK